MHSFLPALPTLRRLLALAAIGTALSQSAVAAPEPLLVPTTAASEPGGDLISQRAAKAPAPAVATETSGNTALVDRVRDKASDMVTTAMNFLGVPYRRGGQSAERGFDCSGFTRQVFERSLGLLLPRRADEQARAPGLVAIVRSELQPGDLVFFNTLRRTFSHVGIYIGDGKFIHAPRPGGEVRVEDMRFVYWAKRFTGGRRAEPALDPDGGEAAGPVAPLSAASLAPAIR